MGLYILKTNVQTQLSEREPSENKSYYKIANWSQVYLAFTISTVDNSLFIQLSFFFSLDEYVTAVGSGHIIPTKLIQAEKILHLPSKGFQFTSKHYKYIYHAYIFAIESQNSMLGAYLQSQQSWFSAPMPRNVSSGQSFNSSNTQFSYMKQIIWYSELPFTFTEVILKM